ncbi:MAG: hypothetical protein WC825_02770, partial [Gallionellaceae bacterium]
MTLQTKPVEYKNLSLGVALLVLLTLSRSGMTAQGAYSLSSGIDYSSGKYGEPTATEVTYIPFTGKYETDSWILKLTVPYISISGPGNVIANIGQAVNTSNAVRTDAGLGDIVASTNYSLVNSKRSGVIVDITGKVKFGTADKFKGLGSGANDYAGETSIYKIMDSLSVFTTLGYKVFGQSPGYTLDDVFYGSLGISKKMGEQTSTGLIYDYRQATSTWSDPQQIWTVFLNRKINTKWKVQTYLFTGSGNSSPDYGGGAML